MGFNLKDAKQWFFNEDDDNTVTGESVDREDNTFDNIKKRGNRNMSKNSIGLINTITPTTIADIEKVVDNLNQGHSVIINVTKNNDTTIHNMLVYLQGAAYAIKSIPVRIQDGAVYLFVPEGVSIDSDTDNILDVFSEARNQTTMEQQKAQNQNIVQPQRPTASKKDAKDILGKGIVSLK